MKLDYSTIAVIIESINDEASLKGISIYSVDELVQHLDENTNGFVNVVSEEE